MLAMLATEESSDVCDEQNLYRVLTTQPNFKEKCLISPLRKHSTKPQWNSGNKICSCLTGTLNREMYFTTHRK